MPWLDQSLAVFKAASARLVVAMVWSEQAVCHLGLGDDKKAKSFCRKAERVVKENCSTHNYQVIIASIGNIYLHRRDYFTTRYQSKSGPTISTEPSLRASFVGL